MTVNWSIVFLYIFFQVLLQPQLFALLLIPINLNKNEVCVWLFSFSSLPVDKGNIAFVDLYRGYFH